VAIIDSGKLLKLDTPDNLKKSIGAGDVMEMKLVSRQAKGLSRAALALKAAGYEVMQEEERFNIRAMNLVPRIHEIYKLLEQEGITVQEMQIRENTLEDVFIHLTGKSLRR
jgi:ABC-2 type transport system ATP-binding protein